MKVTFLQFRKVVVFNTFVLVKKYGFYNSTLIIFLADPNSFIEKLKISKLAFDLLRLTIA